MKILIISCMLLSPFTVFASSVKLLGQEANFALSSLSRFCQKEMVESLKPGNWISSTTKWSGRRGYGYTYYVSKQKDSGFEVQRVGKIVFNVTLKEFVSEDGLEYYYSCAFQPSPQK